MATDYSVQLRGVEGVASADPSTAMRAEQMRGEQVSSIISNVSSTIFDAYKGFKEEEVRRDVQGDYDNLKWEMNAIKDAEQRNNSIAQVTERTPAAVKAFKDEQERLGQAVLQMPERASEWRMRSSKSLREAIAKTPGMANSFRQIAQQITGIKDLDMYSVTNLYDEIDMVAKRQQQTAQAAARADEEGRKSFAKDMAPFMPETASNAMWPQLTPEQRVQITQDAFATELSKKKLKESIESGGLNLQNSMVSFISQANTGNVAKMNELRVQLRDAGINEEALLTGKMTPDGMANPKAQSILAQASAIHRQYIEQRYREGNALLQGALKDPTSAEAAKASLAMLDNFYKVSLESLEKNGAIPLLQAMSEKGEDQGKTLAQRITLINSIDSALGIDPLTRKEFQAEDPTQVAALKTRYPQKYAALQHLNKMRLNAMSGIPDKEWFTLVAEGSKIAQQATLAVPTTQVEATATALYGENSAKLMQRDAVVSKPNPGDTLKALSGGFALRDNGETLLKDYSSAIKAQMNLVPEGEREAFMQQVNTAYERAVFGAAGHGDSAWTRLQAFKPGVTTDFADRAAPAFLDYTGATPLQMQNLAVPKRNLTPAQKMALERYNLGADKPKEVNAALTSVDTAIRVRSLVTGEDVRVLRKQFMDTFMKGKPSESYTGSAVRAVIAATQQPPITPTGAALGEPTKSTRKINPLSDPNAEAASDRAAANISERVRIIQDELNNAKKALEGTQDAVTRARLKGDVAALSQELERVSKK